jgi:replicative DNA helicase
MTPRYTIGSDLLSSWVTDLERGEAPTCYKVAEPFEKLDVRPGRLILFGGAPGSGKTAALLQVGIDMLRLNESARLLVANVEMEPSLLLDRIVSRLSSVPLTPLGNRMLTPVQLGRARVAVAGLATVAGRMAFMNPPYSLEHVAAVGAAFEANVMIVDYIQRFSVGGESKSERERLELAAPVLRSFCHAAAAVLVASGMTRQKGTLGSTYTGLGLASFRGSSELEYGADSAYLFEPDKADGIVLRGVKNRFGTVENIVTRFDGTFQTFSAVTSSMAAETSKRSTPRGGPCDS